MNRFIILVVFCFLAVTAFGQSPVDTLSLWNYQLLKHKKPQKDKSVGQITFWRTKPIHDSIHFSRHQELWTPQISFSLFSLSDSVYCDSQSQRIKASSSCMGPDVGGDMYLVGNFILLNRDICLSCVAYVSKRDYCRPVIIKVVDSIDKRKVKTLADLEAQVGIKKGDANSLNR